MASSRLFVKGLPPTFTETEFRKHFARGEDTLTDVKIFPNRRIGYVGYKTPEAAAKALKHFNKTFIRMSRIGVELARPIEESKSLRDTLPQGTKRGDDGGKRDNNADDNSRKRKRDVPAGDSADPKLREFLQVMKPGSKKAAWENVDSMDDIKEQPTAIDVEAAESDDEYEQVPKKVKSAKTVASPEISKQPEPSPLEPEPQIEVVEASDDLDTTIQLKETNAAQVMSDADWARSRTSRLLGLVDDEDEDDQAMNVHKTPTESPTHVSDESDAELDEKNDSNDLDTDQGRPEENEVRQVDNQEESEAANGDIAAVRKSMRLFVRNLPYDVKTEELEVVFASYGDLEEVHIPKDHKSHQAKGFAYIQYSEADAAEQAFVEQDGQTFQGRLIHIIPASAKRESKLDDFALSKLPLKKQQQIKKRREAASSTFNWNSLYMNADAVISSVADRLGLSKSEVLDPTNSDAAIKQAHAETHIIQETKSYFSSQGIDLDSFKQSRRGDTAILIKNIPYDCGRDELRRMLEEHGELKRLLIPPSGTLAIAEFSDALQCKTAFAALAYRKVKNSVLFLEKAPQDLFNGKIMSENKDGVDPVSKISTADLKDASLAVPDSAGSATLFVRNLNFRTTTARLTEEFQSLDGFLTARVKTRTDPKKPGQVLSMGFGFLEFRSASQAAVALQSIDGNVLEGHKLQVRASHKGNDAAEAQRKAYAEKRAANQGTKIIIKNLPFEVTKKDVRALFGAYGQLRSVRVPKKLDRAARGFAFAEFTTSKEAQSAMSALRDTHLLGRRLVLDFAAEDAEDAEAEIEKMQRKVGNQVNKVALQKLTSGGRKKFSTQHDDDDA